jgi:hypothetical protein
MQNITTIDVSASPCLSDQEQERLTELECRIRAGLQGYIEAGLCLAEIRDLRLYRRDYKTFQEYCQGQWGFTPQYCNRLIGASSVVKNLETNVSVLPENEGQCRPLASLTAQQQIEVWLQLTSEIPKERITGRLVQEAVETLQLANDRNLRYHRSKKLFDDFLAENPQVFGKKVKAAKVFGWHESKGKPVPPKQQELLREDVQFFLKGLESTSPLEPDTQAEREALEIASKLCCFSEQQLADGLLRMGSKYVAQTLIKLLPNLPQIEDRERAEEVMNQLYDSADKINDFFGFDE